MTKPQLVCDSPNHFYICWLPCAACCTDCDKRHTRLATTTELILHNERKDDPGYEGIVNQNRNVPDL